MARTEYTSDEQFDHLFEVANTTKTNVKVTRAALMNMLMDYGALRASEMGLGNRVRPFSKDAIAKALKKPRAKAAEAAALDDDLANL